MKGRRHPLPGLCLAYVFIVMGFAAQAQVQVDTLQLKAPIRSWGRLGGLSIDRLGFLYISNFGESVWRVKPDGEITLLTDSLYGTSGNTIDSRGDLLQSSFFDNRVYRITRDGRIEVAAAGLEGPVGLVTDAADNLYVCNCNGNSIVRIGPSGERTELVKDPVLGCPNGIITGWGDDFLVASFGHNRLFRVGTEGELTLFSEVPGAGNAHLARAGATVYVSKVADHRIYAVDKDGVASLLAGTGEVGNHDGSADVATFSHPNGLVATPDGKTLFTNTILGKWRETAPAELRIRRIRLP